MKRTLLVFLLVAGLVLSACGGGATQAPAATEPASSGAQATEAPASVSPVNIKVMMWGSTEELAVWQKIADAFHTVNPDITVSMEVSDWDGYWEKVKVLFAGNTPPDVFAIDGPLFPDWQSRGVLLNLQPYIDQNPGFLDGFYPITLQNYQRADGYYGLPRDFQTIAMFYNKDMFDKAGIAYPKDGWTWDEFRTIAKQLTIDSNGDGKIDQWGVGADLWDMELMWSEVLWSYGGDVINADHTKTLIGDEKSRQGWQLIADLVLTDKSMPDPDTAAQFGYDLFEMGKVAMWPVGHWSVPQYQAAKLNYDVAPMPAGPAGKATSVNSAGFVISKDSKNHDAAWKFIQYALSPEGQKLTTALGLAIPAIKAVAESPVYLQQEAAINNQVFLDELAYAHLKPAFKGYDEWASVVGDGLTPVWTGQAGLNATLDEIVPQADEVLSRNQ